MIKSAKSWILWLRAGKAQEQQSVSWKNKKQIQKGAEQDGVAQNGERAGETVQTFGTQLALIIAYTERELKALKAMSVPSPVIIILRITDSTGFVLVVL